MPALTLDRYDDVTTFLAAAGPYLRAREVEHALMLGIASAVESGRQYAEEQNWFVRVRDGERTVAAALRTPPHNVLVSAVEDERAIELIARAVLEDSRPPGMFGPSEVGARFVELWHALAGEDARVAVAQRLFVLTSVVAPATVEGSLRPIEERDRAIVVDWLAAFEQEAMANEEPGDLNPNFDLRLEGPADATGLWVWELGDQLVSLTGYGGRSDHGMRVGPVYTPPEERGHGYASGLVAGVTQWLLDEGRDWVCLYTDLSNPTSNKIYQAIGYKPVLDFDQYAFVTDEDAG